MNLCQRVVSCSNPINSERFHTTVVFNETVSTYVLSRAYILCLKNFSMGFKRRKTDIENKCVTLLLFHICIPSQQKVYYNPRNKLKAKNYTNFRFYLFSRFFGFKLCTQFFFFTHIKKKQHKVQGFLKQRLIFWETVLWGQSSYCRERKKTIQK